MYYSYVICIRKTKISLISPMVVASVGAVSVICDETDRVWMYEERWNLESIAKTKIGRDREKEAADIEVKSTPYTST